MNTRAGLASHASFFNITQKLARLALKPKLSPFIDPQGYIDFVKRTETAFHNKLNKQIKAAKQQLPK